MREGIPSYLAYAREDTRKGAREDAREYLEYARERGTCAREYDN